jgi:hypothetical protein
MKYISNLRDGITRPTRRHPQLQLGERIERPGDCTSDHHGCNDKEIVDLVEFRAVTGKGRLGLEMQDHTLRWRRGARQQPELGGLLSGKS